MSAVFAKSSRGSPTFLNLDQRSGRFTIVIWEQYRPIFNEAPEALFDGKWVCIQGKIQDHEGVPQIHSLGGDIAHPARFWPLTGDARTCLADGANMSVWCTTVVDAQRIENEMYMDVYFDALDAQGDLYSDLEYPPPDYEYVDPGPWTP